MQSWFEAVNNFFAAVVPITDFLWDFPTNLDWYASIPVLGNLSFAILLLVGAGIYFTIRLRAIQVTKFTAAARVLADRHAATTGISPWAAFLLSSAMRIGPGNIMGVTGAISVGGPGALFWMWVAAFFGMATAFSEATLAQIFKEKKGDEYVGGLPFYARKVLGDSKFWGVLMAGMFIAYVLLCLPGQTFHMFTSVGMLAEIASGAPMARDSITYWVIGITTIIACLAIAIGGLKRVIAFTNKMVPPMAILYFAVIILLLLFNIGEIPGMFASIFAGAFSPDAIFGGALGVAIAQGVRRGLMSNEAGQGTITMAAATSENDHPCEQGIVQSMGVFLDTMIICTLTGFAVIAARIWDGDAGVSWTEIFPQKLQLYLASIRDLMPGSSFDNAAAFIVTFCYALFAFTTLVGMIIFSEIAANRISRNTVFTKGVRMTGAIVFVPVGVLSVLAGLELGNLWYLADMANIMMVYGNVPILLIASGIIIKATRHYVRQDGTPFTSEVIGREIPLWDDLADERAKGEPVPADKA